MYCIVEIFAEGVDFKCSHHKEKKVTKWGDDLLVNLVMNISQCMHISNHHIVHVKYMQLYLSIIPQ